MQSRIGSLDIIRVLAIFMVLVTHATEVFYISNVGALAIKPGDEFWVNLFNSSAHACVALFVVVSGYLLLPIKGSSSEFYLKRIPRIFIPFLIWSAIYLLLPLAWGGTNSEAVKEGAGRLLYTFSWTSGHLWFIYMLIGVYLIIPIISPWIKECSRRGEEFFLGIWLFSTLYHFLIQHIPDRMMLGQTFFSEFSSIYYFSGFLGYAVLGHYIKVHLQWKKEISIAIGVLLYTLGFLMTYFLFAYQLDTAKTLEDLTLSLRSCTINVALMAIGIFLMLKDIDIKNTKIRTLFFEFSKFSFGIYLAHMLILPFINKLLGKIFSTPITILLVSLITLLLTYVVVKVISYFPKSGYLVAT
jgi:surface polysaccharide O-acyltransferase-like enzyme